MASAADGSKTIVVGFDGSDASQDALALGAVLARATGARLVAANVYTFEPAPLLVGAAEYNEALRQDAMIRVAKAHKDLLGDLQLHTDVVESRSTAQGLHDLALAAQAEAIVVGSTHRSAIGRVLPGTVADKLLDSSPSAVAVAARGFARAHSDELRVIGVGFDGSPESHVALRAAVKLALGAGAALRVIAAGDLSPAVATPPPGGYGYAEALRARHDQLRAQLDEALDALPGEVRAEGKLLKGSPASVLVDEAEKGLDLLVLGSRGYGPIRRVLLGSVSSKVAHSAPCPVMVVPRGVDAGDAGSTESYVVAEAS